MKIKLFPLFVPEIITLDGTIISYKVNPIYDILTHILIVLSVLFIGVQFLK